MKWYQKTWGIILLLIVFFPAGLYLMWKYANWNKKAKGIVSVIFAFILIISMMNGNNTPKNTYDDSGVNLKEDNTTVVENNKNVNDHNSGIAQISDTESLDAEPDGIIKLKYGELLNVNEDLDNSRIIIKAKIEPSMTNNLTIQQNGFNIEDFILNQGGDKYNEIQYWAIADMQDGSEGKVISFTVGKDLINSIKNKNVVGNKIIDNATDLWILPSLSKNK